MRAKPCDLCTPNIQLTNTLARNLLQRKKKQLPFDYFLGRNVRI